MEYIERWIKARNSWLVGHRKRRIVGVMFHSTRSTKSDGDDGPRTEAWDSNPTNLQSFQDLLVFEAGDRVICCDWDKGEFPQWCAGYGDIGTWAASDHYLQVEVAQGNLYDPFTQAQIDSLAQWTARQANKYNFPIAKIPYLTQVGEPPPGITTHDTCANGRKLGKSDTGYMFPWTPFLALAELYRTGGNNMADYVTREEMRTVLLRLCCGSERLDPVAGITVQQQDWVISEWLKDPIHTQSLSDVSYSAMAVAQQALALAQGIDLESMEPDEVRAFVAETIQSARLVVPE